MGIDRKKPLDAATRDLVDQLREVVGWPELPRARLVLIGGGGMGSEKVIKPLEAIRANGLKAQKTTEDIEKELEEAKKKMDADTYDTYGVFAEVFALVPKPKTGKGISVVWLSAASDDTDVSAQYRQTHLCLPGMKEKYGLGKVQCFGIADAKQGNDPKIAQAILEADCVLIGGGDQKMIAERITEGSAVREALRHVYMKKPGVVIGGTSAGAMVMSAKMIDGGVAEPKEKEKDVVKEMKPGIGFLNSVIIDTHFSGLEREPRLPRLKKAVLAHPGRAGIGVDERTLLILEGGKATVHGEGKVTLLLPMAHLDSRVPLAQISYGKGESFDFSTYALPAPGAKKGALTIPEIMPPRPLPMALPRGKEGSKNRE